STARPTIKSTSTFLFLCVDCHQLCSRKRIKRAEFAVTGIEDSSCSNAQGTGLRMPGNCQSHCCGQHSQRENKILSKGPSRGRLVTSDFGPEKFYFHTPATENAETSFCPRVPKLRAPSTVRRRL